jgi:ABC-type nitrate/sulfonate/bicarbonate transport system substrate-binding protein
LSLRPRRSARRCFGLVLAGLAACSAPAEERSQKVRLGIGTYLTDAVEIVAYERGIFAAHGVDVELVPVRSNSVMLATLLAGEVDAAACGPLNPRCFNIVERGADVRFVFARSHYAADGCAHDAFLVRADLLRSGRVSDPESLRGLRLTTERTGSNYFYFSRLLASGGLTMADVEIVDVPTASRLEAFVQGRIDVASATEPRVTRMTRDGAAVLWRRVADVLPDFQSSHMLFGERLLAAAARPRRALRGRLSGGGAGVARGGQVDAPPGSRRALDEDRRRRAARDVLAGGAVGRSAGRERPRRVPAVGAG